MAFPHDGKKFPPKTSGNPAGRPKGRSLTSTLRGHLDAEARIKGKDAGHGITNRDLLIQRMCDEAIKTGDVALLRLIFDRHDGKAPEGGELHDESPANATDPETARRIMRAASGGVGPDDKAPTP